jgi:hypothetical protein
MCVQHGDVLISTGKKFHLHVQIATIQQTAVDNIRYLLNYKNLVKY